MVPSTARSVGFDAAALSRAASTRSRASRARILDAHAPSRARESSIARASARLAAAAADGHGMMPRCGITSSRARGRHDLRRRSRVQTAASEPPSSSGGSDVAVADESGPKGIRGFFKQLDGLWGQLIPMAFMSFSLSCLSNVGNHIPSSALTERRRKEKT